MHYARLRRRGLEPIPPPPPPIRPLLAREFRQQVRASNGGGHQHWIDVRNMVCDAQVGDRAAAERLLRLFEPYCQREAMRWSRRRGGELADYLQVARLALVFAVDAWNEERAARHGTRSFMTFAAWQVTHHLHKHSDLDSIVTVPVNARDERGHRPEPGVTWLDAPARGRDAAPVLAFKSSPVNVEAEIIERDLRDAIRRTALRSARSIRERATVLRLLDVDELTQKDQAAADGCSYQAVQQIERRVLERLRSSLLPLAA